ncbi:hypothetical protein [Nocardia sp. NPDC052566]|uniref:hypothetical protein n=1 Tax=Nocardia sp. NPDC052566 TaxID=3364330 RepID=UPI0037C9866A
MSEKYRKPQPDSGGAPHERTASTPTESDSNHEQQLIGEVGEAMLQTIYDAVEHPVDEIQPAVAELALALVQVTHSFDLNADTGKQALAMRARYVTDRIVALVRAYDELTTSDLQGAVDALALLLVRNVLPIDEAGQTEGGDHE